jgi:hypothetical protein
MRLIGREPSSGDFCVGKPPVGAAVKLSIVLVFVMIVIGHFHVIMASRAAVATIRVAVVTGGHGKADGEQGNGKNRLCGHAFHWKILR